MDGNLNDILEIKNPAEEPNSSQERAYNYFKDPASLSNIVIILFWSSLVLGVIILISNLMQLGLINRGHVTYSEARDNDLRQEILQIISVILLTITRIYFLIWVYNMNRNCRNFNSQAMEFTPGWSVGWFFIPVANLFQPYKVMKEIWHVSGNPETGRQLKYSGDNNKILVWWCVTVAAIILSAIVYVMGKDIYSIRVLEKVTIWAIVSNIVAIASFYLSVSIVKEIFARQKNTVSGNLNISDGQGSDIPPQFFCSECKRQVKEEDNFCPHCGADLKDLTEET